MTDLNPIIELQNITFRWTKLAAATLKLKQLEINSGEKVFIKGPSGSGKTTLLNLIAGVLVPESGTIRILGEHISQYNPAQRDRLRGDHMGFIFQLFNLIPYLSVLENVILPCKFSNLRCRRILKKGTSLITEAKRLLTMLRVSDEQTLNKKVTKLSVGQQQRVAVARALMGNPEIVIADEPTSSLDSDAKEAFIKLLFEECSLAEATLLFVSHDGSLTHLFDRTIHLQEINEVSVENEFSEIQL